jgi:hypothetical protein
MTCKIILSMLRFVLLQNLQNIVYNFFLVQNKRNIKLHLVQINNNNNNFIYGDGFCEYTCCSGIGSECLQFFHHY